MGTANLTWHYPKKIKFSHSFAKNFLAQILFFNISQNITLNLFYIILFFKILEEYFIWCVITYPTNIMYIWSILTAFKKYVKYKIKCEILTCVMYASEQIERVLIHDKYWIQHFHIQYMCFKAKFYDPRVSTYNSYDLQLYLLCVGNNNTV